MKLTYKEKFPWGKPTLFKEKVLESKKTYFVEDKMHTHGPLVILPKIHYFKEDPGNRWPPVSKRIHHIYHNLTPKEDCFLENGCTGVQKIEIFHPPTLPAIRIYIDEKLYLSYPKGGSAISVPYHFVERMIELCQNEGFDHPADFLKWHDENFKGKIIHWTLKRYRS
jgi:hypothetical protein